MKIALAQVQPVKGDIAGNINQHCHFINNAISNGADALFFPELSLTGYEPSLAKDLVTTQDDVRFNIFQSLSDENNVIIGAGLPTTGSNGIHISMVVFQPHLPRKAYSKQYLHDDELPYFVPGNEQIYITIQNKKIALAICYESLLPQHAEMAGKAGADLYLASVAKSVSGIEKAYRHYPVIAKAYSIPVLMTNCVGYCDNFQSAGSSAAWNKEGDLVGTLNERNEGLLIFDTATTSAMLL